MNTIKVYLAESGRVADLRKDFPLYKGQFQNVLLNVYVPISLLAEGFKTIVDRSVTSEYVAGTAVKIGVTHLELNGQIKESKSYFMRYLKTLTYQSVEYALFERKLPKEFTAYVGQGQNATNMIINVVNVDTESTPTKVTSIITSQVCSMDVLPSADLSGEEVIEASELEAVNARLNSIDQILPQKQDKVDEGLNTSNKSVVGGINEIKSANDTNTTNIEQNTQDISKNKQDIADLKAQIGGMEDYIGTLQWTSESPITDDTLNNFVAETAHRDAKNGDVVIVIQVLEGETDKNFKYIKTIAGWKGFEIPPIEKAKNGTFGIISGTYGVSAGNTLVDIVGGEIVNIYVKDENGGYRNIREYVNANARDLHNILEGNTAVGVALKAISDDLGNNIVETYMTNESGATKEFVYNYSLPREFNDVYYITSEGYTKDLPTKSTPQFTKSIASASYAQIFQLTRIIEAEYEISRKNSCGTSIQFSTSSNVSFIFRLVTEARKVGEDWRTLSIEVTNQIDFVGGQIKRVDFDSMFTYLENDVLSLENGDMIRQTLEAFNGDINTKTISIYSNEVYPSLTNLNTVSQVIYYAAGKLGEQPVYMSENTAKVGTEVRTYLVASELNENTECRIDIAVPIGMQLNDTDSIKMRREWGDETESIDIIAPSGTDAKIKDIKQAATQFNRTSLYGTDRIFSIKCFITKSGTRWKFFIDEDNLEGYATKEELDEIKLFKSPNAVIQGEPIINSGQISGFSTENYLMFPFILDVRDRPFQVDFCFTTGDDVTTQQNVLDSKFGIALAIKNGKGLMAVSNNGTSWASQGTGIVTIQPNTTYYARIIWNRFVYKTQISTDGTTYADDISIVNATTPYPATIYIGGGNATDLGHSATPFGGIINLNKAYLYVDGQLIWQGMDDAGLATRADVSLSNLDSAGMQVIKENGGTDIKVDNVKQTEISFTSDPQTQLNNKVPTTRTVNGKSLANNITLTAGDVGASTFSGNYSDLTNKPTIPDSYSKTESDGRYPILTNNTISLNNLALELSIGSWSDNTKLPTAKSVYDFVHKDDYVLDTEIETTTKWINGKSIYRLTKLVSLPNSTSWTNLFYLHSRATINQIIKIEGLVQEGNNYLPIPVSEGSYYRNLRWDASSGNIQTINNGFGGDAYITVYFTRN